MKRGESNMNDEILICEWNNKECIGKDCVWYDRVEPVLGKLCPVIVAHYNL